MKPMQVIQASTKWPAEAVKHGNELGTVEIGKPADLLVVNADPLQDTQGLKKSRM
jgi:imidazolonepropionase-like amidohydrolase